MVLTAVLELIIPYTATVALRQKWKLVVSTRTVRQGPASRLLPLKPWFNIGEEIGPQSHRESDFI